MAHHTFTIQDGESPSGAIVRAISELENCNPEELPEIYEYIDPQTLDHLFDSVDAITVEFEYHGYKARIQSDGKLLISPL